MRDYCRSVPVNYYVMYRLAADGGDANMRLLGTEVSLIHVTTATTICGTINSLNPGGQDVNAQTYTVSRGFLSRFQIFPRSRPLISLLGVMSRYHRTDPKYLTD